MCAREKRARAQDPRSRQESKQGTLQSVTAALEKGLWRRRRPGPKAEEPLSAVGVEDLGVEVPRGVQGQSLGLALRGGPHRDRNPPEEACLRRGEGGCEGL